jgi:hypothetical protein
MRQSLCHHKTAGSFFVPVTKSTAGAAGFNRYLTLDIYIHGRGMRRNKTVGAKQKREKCGALDCRARRFLAFLQKLDNFKNENDKFTSRTRDWNELIDFLVISATRRGKPKREV